MLVVLPIMAYNFRMDTYRKYDHLNMANPKRGGRKLSPKDGSFLSLLLFWILPFLVVNGILFFALTSQPNFEVTVNDPGDYKSAEIVVKVKSIFPNNGLNVKLAEVPVEMEEKENKTYTATVYTNGTLEVSMENKNGMNKIVYENVNCIDDTPPTFTESDNAAGFVSFYVDDSQSGVDFGSLYAIDSNGNRLTPSMIDEGESLVVFNYDTPTLEVHAFDNVGQESVISFTNAAPADVAEVTAADGEGEGSEDATE